MMASTMSLALQPRGSVPSTRTSRFFAFFASSVCVASTCSTSLVPMPCASAPNAPCVGVERVHLQLRGRIRDAAAAVRGGHVVVAHREIGRQPPDLALGDVQALEG